jgi:hypothetical protein
MNLISEQFPDPDSPNRTRYRRRKRFFPAMPDASRSELLENLANRVSPNFDFFLFSLLAGAVIGLAFLFNSHALLLLAALLAPIMAPIIGVSLAAATGGARFFFLSLASAFVGCLLVFIVGILAGAARAILPENASLQPIHFSTVSWDNLFVLILGVILTALSFVKSEQKPVLPSAAVAYVIFSTVGGIGFDLGQRNFQTAADGGLTLGFYLLFAAIAGGIIFFAFRFRPISSTGYILPLVLIVLSGLLVIQFKPFNAGKFLTGWVATPQPNGIEVKPATIYSSTPVASQTAFTQAPQFSKTPTLKSTSTRTPTLTITPTGTPDYASMPDWLLVDADGQSGARLRDNPGFASKQIMIIENGVRVKLLPGVEFKDNVYWAHVQTIDGTIGWMVHTVLSTSTPSASSTPTQE